MISWCNLEGCDLTVRSWRDDLPNEISRLDLAGASSMTCLGLGKWSELNDASPISLSLVSLRALSLSLRCLSPEII